MYVYNDKKNSRLTFWISFIDELKAAPSLTAQLLWKVWLYQFNSYSLYRATVIDVMHTDKPLNTLYVLEQYGRSFRVTKDDEKGDKWVLSLLWKPLSSFYDCAYACALSHHVTHLYSSFQSSLKMMRFQYVYEIWNSVVGTKNSCWRLDHCENGKEGEAVYMKPNSFLTFSSSRALKITMHSSVCIYCNECIIE